MMSKDKLSEIDLQIKSLQEKKKKLEEKQSLQLIQTIKKTGAFSIPEDILIGAVLEAVKSYNDNKESAKKWQQVGKDFLKAGKKENGKTTQTSFQKPSNSNH